MYWFYYSFLYKGKGALNAYRNKVSKK